MTTCLLDKTLLTFPCFILYFNTKLGCYSRYLLTSCFCILIAYDEKDIYFKFYQFSLGQSLSRVWLFATPRTAAHQASLSITISRSSLKLTSIKLVMPSTHLILCRPLFLLPPIPPSIRVFSNESTLCMSWPKYWSSSLSISPSNEHPWLVSFRMDWLDLLSVQGTLKSLLQHHSSKASILQCFTLLYGSIHPSLWFKSHISAWLLTIWTIVSKLISLLFNMLSRLVITFLPRNFMAAITICSEMQIKTTMRYHLTPIRMASIYYL